MKFAYLCLGVFVLSAAACKQSREPRTYSVAKEAAPGTAPQAPATADPHAQVPGMAPAATAPGGPGGDPHAGLSADQLATVRAGNSPQITDTPPPGWKKMPLSSMRQASYIIEGEGGATVDVSLVILRGAAGGTLINVNRWRDQLGQPAIDEATLKQTCQNLTTPVGAAVAVAIEGLAPGGNAAKDGRMFGVIANKDKDAWFYKMRGNAALAASEKDNFMRWVLSVKPATAEAPVATVPAPVVPVVPPPAVTEEGGLSWQLPAGWTVAPAASTMRYATISVVAADGSKGELIVSHFPGDVGGDLENVNRWCQQVGHAPVDQVGLAALISKLNAGPKSLALIDVTGPQSRLVAGWTRHGADTWFFKLTGPDALVGAEKAKFTGFLESVRFTKPE